METMNSAAEPTESHPNVLSQQPSEQEVHEIIIAVREATGSVAPSLHRHTRLDDAINDAGASSYYWDAATMAPLSATSAVSI